MTFVKTKVINIKYLAQCLEHGIVQWGISLPPYIQLHIYYIYNYIKMQSFIYRVYIGLIINVLHTLNVAST